MGALPFDKHIVSLLATIWLHWTSYSHLYTPFSFVLILSSCTKGHESYWRTTEVLVCLLRFGDSNHRLVHISSKDKWNCLQCWCVHLSETREDSTHVNLSVQQVTWPVWRSKYSILQLEYDPVSTCHWLLCISNTKSVPKEAAASQSCLYAVLGKENLCYGGG